MRDEGGDAGDALRIAYPYYGLLGCEAYIAIRITYYGFEAQSVLRIACRRLGFMRQNATLL